MVKRAIFKGHKKMIIQTTDLKNDLIKVLKKKWKLLL